MAATISPTTVRAALGAAPAPMAKRSATTSSRCWNRRAAEQRRLDRHDRVAAEQSGGKRGPDCQLPADRSARRPAPDPADSSGACDIGAFESIDAGTPTPTATATPDRDCYHEPTATASPPHTATATATITATPTATRRPPAPRPKPPTATSTATATATSTGTATATATADRDAPTATTTATANSDVRRLPRPRPYRDRDNHDYADSPSPTPKPPPMKLTISPKSLSFGSVKTGDAPIKSVTLHNKSKTNEYDHVPQVTGQYFSLASNTCDAGVPPGGTCKIGVSFAPLTKGKKFTGSLTFRINRRKRSQDKAQGQGRLYGPRRRRPRRRR